MRIVAVADTHLFHRDPSTRWRVPEGDVFLHAGDMCRGGDLEELALAMEWIASLPHRHKIVVAGNHDRAFEETPEAARAIVPPGVIYLQDAGATVDGVHFYGSPWTVAYMGWAFNAERGAEIAAHWAKIPADVDILVTHGPPFGHGDGSSVASRFGCHDLLARIQVVRPRAHLFGHIHEGGGLTYEGDVPCVNVTTWECERDATVFDFDAATRHPTFGTIPPAR